MPIVTREEIWTKLPKKKYIVKISFTKRNGFSADIPGEITDRVGYLFKKSDKGHDGRHASYENIIAYVKRLFDAYDNHGCEKKKIISYNVRLVTTLPAPLGRGDAREPLWGESGNSISFSKREDLVRLEYEILWKHYYDDTYYYYDEKDEKLVSKGFYKSEEMDWTEQREAFFRTFKLGLQGLIMQLDSFLHEGDKSIEYIADNADLGNIALLAPPNEKLEDK